MWTKQPRERGSGTLDARAHPWWGVIRGCQTARVVSSSGAARQVMPSWVASRPCSRLGAGVRLHLFGWPVFTQYKGSMVRRLPTGPNLVFQEVAARPAGGATGGPSYRMKTKTTTTQTQTLTATSSQSALDPSLLRPESSRARTLRLVRAPGRNGQGRLMLQLMNEWA